MIALITNENNTARNNDSKGKKKENTVQKEVKSLVCTLYNNSVCSLLLHRIT